MMISSCWQKPSVRSDSRLKSGKRLLRVDKEFFQPDPQAVAAEAEKFLKQAPYLFFPFCIDISLRTYSSPLVSHSLFLSVQNRKSVQKL